jgi:uncharacterized protein (DUF58 family)
MNKRWYVACLGILILALLFRQPLILIVGLLALLVLLLIDIWAKYCLAALRFERTLSQQRVNFGEEITLSATVENAKILPLPWLEIEDDVPRTLPVRGRHLRVNPATNRALLESLFSTRWYERITRRYTLACTTRGVHMFGPTTMRSGDLFGFTEKDTKLENRQYLLVYPLIVPLSSFNLPARHPFGDRRAPRRLLEDPSRVIGVRDYVYGDDMRRVHWKATARALKLQSKIYEPTTTYTLALFLNVGTQLNTYFHPHPDLLELAICAAASVVDWALREGYAVGLYTNGFPHLPELSTYQSSLQDQATSEVGAGTIKTGSLKQRGIRVPPASSGEQFKRLMEALARVQSFFNDPIEEVVQRERAHLPAGATVAVITSIVSDPLLDSLSRLRRSGHSVALLMASDQPTARRLAGIPVYHLGGSDTWRALVACYNQGDSEQEPEEATPKEQALAAFQL